MKRSMGKTLWQIRVITKGDVRAAEDLLKEEENRSTISTTGRFAKFVEVNIGLYNNISALMKGFVGQMITSGMMWSSILTYFKIGSAFLHQANIEIKRSEQKTINDLQKKINLKLAEEKSTRPSTVATIKKLQSILQHVPKKIKSGVALMLYTGARWRDIRRLRREQLVVRTNKKGRRELAIQYRVTKNRRVRQYRVVVTIPEELGVTIPEEIINLLLQNADPEEQPWDQFSTTDINAGLTKACEKASVDRVTTYVFRHAFIHRTRQYCEENQLSLIAFTGHLTENVVEAFYHSLLGEESDEEEAGGR